MSASFLWIKAFHVMAMVAWFAGIFYLPRLFVYHSLSQDTISLERFAVMERKLYRGIMTPAMILTWIFGLIMVWQGWSVYKTQLWLHLKFLMVLILTAYHFLCGYYRTRLIDNPQLKSHVFWRAFNEIPTVILAVVVILVIVKPF